MGLSWMAWTWPTAAFFVFIALFFGLGRQRFLTIVFILRCLRITSLHEATKHFANTFTFRR